MDYREFDYVNVSIVVPDSGPHGDKYHKCYQIRTVAHRTSSIILIFLKLVDCVRSDIVWNLTVRQPNSTTHVF